MVCWIERWGNVHFQIILFDASEQVCPRTHKTHFLVAEVYSSVNLLIRLRVFYFIIMKTRLLGC
jgi:hypothetical protein